MVHLLQVVSWHFATLPEIFSLVLQYIFSLFTGSTVVRPQSVPFASNDSQFQTFVVRPLNKAMKRNNVVFVQIFLRSRNESAAAHSEIRFVALIHAAKNSLCRLNNFDFSSNKKAALLKSLTL